MKALKLLKNLKKVVLFIHIAWLIKEYFQHLIKLHEFL